MMSSVSKRSLLLWLAGQRKRLRNKSINAELTTRRRCNFINLSADSIQCTNILARPPQHEHRLRRSAGSQGSAVSHERVSCAHPATCSAVQEATYSFVAEGVCA